MVKAIIFDCFGVLATEAWIPFKAKHFGHDPELLAQASTISWQANRGLISRDDALHAVAKLAGLKPAEAAQAINRNVPDEALFAYIRELKPNYKIGLLSNVAGDYLAEIFEPAQLALFDNMTLSFQHGFIKPEREAFAAATKQLGVDAADCVFVDDQACNIDGARRAGMQAILYRDAAQFQQELGALLA